MERSGSDVDTGELSELRFADVMRPRQTSPLPTPRTGVPDLPLGELDPGVFERLAAEMIKRRPNHGAHFYGRVGQKQYGLDIVEQEAADFTIVYQVRRYQSLTPTKISLAVAEYADPQPPEPAAPKPSRRFDANKYVLLTSAEFENDTALRDRLEELQAEYAGDLIIDVWGRERVSAELRDGGSLVSSVFGPEWARLFCGFAPPPPRPGDPDRLGLVEDPVQVLNLDALASDAQEQESDHPLESARLYGVLADTLEEANFPTQAAGQRAHQGRLLRAGGDNAGAFAVFWSLALAHFIEGAASRLGSVYHDLDQLRPDLDALQMAKLDALAAAQDWYKRGSQLAMAVPALESVRAADDPEAPLLACLTVEQALVDDWFDFDPAWSLVDPGENTADLLNRLRRCASGLRSPDVVIRARLACALADASLTVDSSAADTEAAFGPILRQAGAGRYLHAGGLIFARAAYAFVMHGDPARAIDLWRQSILLSSESRLYGDVVACRSALNAAVFEQPQPQFSDVGYVGSLPNADRLIAAAQSAELDALRAAQAGKLPDALGVTRRYLWESRLSGHLSDERDALEMFGDVMLAAGRQPVAVTAWVMAGAASKAAEHAMPATEALDVGPWVTSPVRARRAAAAQVIGAQARLYGAAAAERAVHQLLALTAGLWKSLRIAPNPALDAVNALCNFGRDLPASAVDPVLELLDPLLSAGSALTPETVNLVVQLYWAVPGRRDDLALLIGSQLARGDPPPHLWEMVGNLPSQTRAPVTPSVTTLADAGNGEALLTLARWGQPSPAVQLAARRTCAYLLRQPAGQPATTWSFTTQYSDAADLLTALVNADTVIDVDARDLRPSSGPVLAGKTYASMIVSTAASPAPTVSLPSTVRPSQAEAMPQAQPGAVEGPADRTGTGAVPNTKACEPDQPAMVAAGPPAALAVAVAEHLLLVAESHHPPAFVRVEALSALRSLLRRLSAEENAHLAGRLLAIAEDPALNELDQAELGSQDPLSRGRQDTGATKLPILALLMAAESAAAAAEADAELSSLPADRIQRLINHAVGLLRNPDQTFAKFGAAAIARVSKCDPGFARYTAALIAHPNDEVRSVAAVVAVLDDTAQRILAADPSSQVRANLAGRARELADDVLASLHADTHADVLRVFNTPTPSDNGRPPS